MILAGGKVYDSAEQSRILSELPERINETREHRTLSCAAVIDALDRMSRRIAEGAFDALLEDKQLRSQVQYAAQQLSREALSYEVRTELGEDWEVPVKAGNIIVQTMPLGVILHVAAGNMDALPAWSVIEGLLAGNINLLKLPQADKGLTIQFFQMLLAESPELRDFIYVFDTSSTDIAGMQALAAVSDGIAVWGGDAAVHAVRQLAPIGCKLIEWGHRLGFCYIAGEPTKSDLSALASHILQTRQLLCSSCQVIYLDTEDMAVIHHFCETFLPYLENAAAQFPVTEPGAAAGLTLRRYTEELEAVISGTEPDFRVFQGKNCSVTACADNALELSAMYGNILVKPLPRRDLMRTLRTAKDYLQTAGLICDASDREELTSLLFRCGVNRVLLPGKMSAAFAGEPHDGEYPLRRYTRIVTRATSP